MIFVKYYPKENIGLLQQYGVLKRIGGRKNGHWEIL